jgi:hypothetical protein
MYSSAELWENGTRIWKIEHQADDGIKNLAFTGKLPAAFESIRNKYALKQEEADRNNGGVDYYFEIPLVLAQQMTGFKHDKKNPEIDGRFEELIESERKAKKPWWRFW